MNVKTIRCLWDGSNTIREKAFYHWDIELETNKSFKQFCIMKAGKEAVKKAASDYIVKASKEAEVLEVEFLDAYVSDSMLYIDVKTDETNIADLLSFRCNTSLWFELFTSNHLKSM